MKLYTGIDLSNNSIKIAVFEKYEKDIHLLACEEILTNGMRKGSIMNTEMVADDIKEGINRIEEKLGIAIEKVILSISSKNIVFNMLEAKIEVENPDNIVGEDITYLIKTAVKKGKVKDYQMITSSPIGFILDNGEMVKDPKGMSSTTLESKIVATYITTKELYNVINVFEKLKIEVVDITFKSIADYYQVKNDRIDKTVGAIINIGEDSTSIGIFNKGIMIKNSILNVGSRDLDHDYSYQFKVNLSDARMLKENYAVVDSKYLESNSDIILSNEMRQQLVIKPEEIVKVTELRALDILKKAKNEIKNLTNREISYIIVLGGFSEIKGFIDKAYNILGDRVVIFDNHDMGIRNNKWSSIVGLIKYFDDKLDLRGIEYKMFDDEKLRIISDINNITDESIYTTFKQFVNNKEEEV